MPTYEYLCRQCGTRLEVVQSFSDDALTVCDDCGGELRKVFSAAGLIFKGSGWHIKDYSGAGSSGGSGGGSGGSSGSGGSDARPAEGGATGSKAAPAASPSSPSSTPSSSSSGGSSGADAG